MGKHDNMVIPRECEFLAIVELYYGLFKKNVYAKTRSGARYQLYLEATRQELVEVPFLDFMNYAIKIKKVGSPKLKSLYDKNDKFKMERFDRVRKSRGIEFAYLGMSVDLHYCGGVSAGYIVGANTSENLDIYFPDTDLISNCHPYWELTYYDDDDDVVRCYKENEVNK
jgi:hypothetical protein